MVVKEWSCQSRTCSVAYKVIFKDELGIVKGVIAKIHIYLQSSPQFCNPGTLPYALRERMLYELGALEEGMVKE